MTRGTTPIYMITLEEVNPAQIDDLYVTFRQDGLKVTKTSADIDIVDDVLQVPLTQEETLMFRCGHLNIQVRGIIGEAVFATNIVRDKVEPILLEGVIPDDV